MKKILLFVTASLITSLASITVLQAQVQVNAGRLENNTTQPGSFQPLKFYNPASVSGVIEMDSNLFSSMNEINNGQPIGSSMMIELWQIKTYIKKEDPSLRVTKFVEKAGDPGLSYNINNNTSETKINYRFSNLAADGEFAVVIYFLNKPSEYGLIEIKNLPAPNLPEKDVNDIKSKISENIITWADFAIPKSPSVGMNLSSCDFSVSGITGIVMNTKSILSDVTDFIENAADKLIPIIPEGTPNVAGFFINSAGGFVIQVGIIVLDVIVYGNLPKARVMTQAEYDWANDKIFANTLPSRESIIITNMMGKDKRPYTIPNGFGQIYLNIGDLYDDPMNKKRSDREINGQVFIHELTHVWQIEHNPDLKILKEGAINQWRYTVLDDKTVYTYDCGRVWNSYNFERQAKITETAYVQMSSEPWMQSNCEIALVEQNIRFGNSFGIDPATRFDGPGLNHTLNDVVVRDIGISPGDGSVYVLGIKKADSQEQPVNNNSKSRLNKIGDHIVKPSEQLMEDGGYYIYKWTGNEYQQQTGRAIRIAVDKSGTPWVVNSKNLIFKWSNSSWQLLPGSATDIAAGDDGSVWAIGTNEKKGGYGIFRWNGNGWDEMDAGVPEEGAIKITVDNSGTVWKVNSNKNIFRRKNNTWEMLPGLAQDIAAGGGKIFIVGANAVAGGSGIYEWNESAGKFANVDLVEKGGGTNISANQKGEVYVTTVEGKINYTMPAIR